MKFDTTEPNQGEFNYYNGDRLVAFAQKHNMRVRGHALVWYSQVAQWLSKDGKKNDKNFTKQQLLDIMKTISIMWQATIKERWLSGMFVMRC